MIAVDGELQRGPWLDMFLRKRIIARKDKTQGSEKEKEDVDEG